MNNQNTALMEIIMTLLTSWKYYVLAFIVYKVFKLTLQTYLQVKTIQFANKDSFSVSINNTSKQISITTSQKIKIDEIERALSAPNSNVLEIDFKKEKAS